MPTKPAVREGQTYSRDGKLYMASKYEPGVFQTKDAAGNWVDAVEYVHDHPDDRTHIFVVTAEDFAGEFEFFEKPPEPEPLPDEAE